MGVSQYAPTVRWGFPEMALAPRYIYPGHGARINDPLKAIDSTISYYMDEAEAVCELIRGKPMTAFMIYKERYLGKGSTKSLPLVARHIGFIAGYIDLLEEQGRIRTEESGGVYYCHAV